MAKAIVNQLAHSLGRRDEGPNIELAERISKKQDRVAVRELVSLLSDRSTAIRFDAIKVLYETGNRSPGLITEYLGEFLNALDHKDNRMRWGAMIALYVMSKARPELLFRHLTSIVDAMDNGTVITRDHGIYILANLAGLKKYHHDCMELLLEQVEKAPVNQFPMYAEKTAEVITSPFVKRLEKILFSRHDALEMPGKQKRIEKILKSLKVIS